MITLRGKLTRNLVEAQPATPAITRSNLPPAGAAATTASAGETIAATSTPAATNPTTEPAEKALVEEWIWRGVWAFGSLPEHDDDAKVEETTVKRQQIVNAEKTVDEVKDVNSEKVQAGSGEESQKEEGQDKSHEMNQKEEEKEHEDETQTKKENNWLDKLTSRITSVRDNEKEEGTTTITNAADGTGTNATSTNEAPENTKPRPFCYRFIKNVNAFDVIVPSSLIVEEEDKMVEDDKAVSEKKMDGDESEVKMDGGGGEVVNGEGDSAPAASADEGAKDEDKNENADVSAVAESKEKQNAASEKATSSNNEKAAKASTVVVKDATSTIQPSTDAASSGYTKPKEESNQTKEADATMSDPSQTTTTHPEKVNTPSESEAQATTTPSAPTADTKQPPAELKPTKPKQTYGDPPYTPANLSHPTILPPGGKWEGHFENIVPNTTTVKKRKDKRDNRVRELFYLFFNSTPPEGAKTAFMDDRDGKNGDEEREKTLLLPDGRIHVRGYGTNRFGTFEIMGSFNLENGVLHCQRMYVETPEDNKEKNSSGLPTTKGRRGRPPKNKDRESGGGSSSHKRGRKRKPSLKKRTMELVGSTGDDGVDSLSGDIATSVKKRARMSSDSAVAVGLGLPQCRDSIDGSSKTKMAPALKGSSGKSSKKKKVSSASKGAMIPSFMPPVVEAMDPLPSDGDPLLARWRAAHYLYYQREEVNQEDGEAAVSTKVNSVIYEGEMVDGYRQGNGICLYDNNTMYEGQWKRNKEHGKGTLMTPDRSKIIYKGDWERGRMHGSGSYYYHKDLLFGGVGHYEGDFRENLRHGRGIYTFPDGSTYEGEWKENTPNGWGLFKWPDGSLYEGFWKNGRRHGNSGTLIVSDGFRYEGAWVENSMEGRGVATYPNGQVYEGMWVAGRREGRGTIRFTNGAVYEGRFKDDNMEGQGTMKMSQNAVIPQHSDDEDGDDENAGAKSKEGGEFKNDWMIPIEFQSDISHIHQKAGFTQVGL